MCSHARTYARTQQRAASRSREKHSYRPAGPDRCVCGPRCMATYSPYIIYSVLSPGGPSVMAVLCPIKITSGAPRRAHHRLGDPGNRTDLFPRTIRPELLFVIRIITSARVAQKRSWKSAQCAARAWKRDRVLHRLCRRRGSFERARAFAVVEIAKIAQIWLIDLLTHTLGSPEHPTLKADINETINKAAYKYIEY